MKKLLDIILMLVTAFTGTSLASCNGDRLFQEVSPAASGVDFSNDIKEDKDLNIIEYLYMYNGGGVAVGDVNNDGLPDIFFTANQKSDKLYINKGGFRFEDVSEKAGIGSAKGDSVWTNGVTMADVNADGWLDVYVCRMHELQGFRGGNLLYINNRNGTFSEKAAEYGLNANSYAQQASFFDFDLDGDLDMFLVNQSVRTPSTYKEASFRSQRDSLAGDRLYENTGNYFVDVSRKAGIYGGAMGYGLALGTGDINNDGYPDIYVANDFHENDYLYYNQGNGTFKEMIKESFGHTSAFSMGNDLADMNNDGLLDLFTLDMKPADEVIFKRSMSPGSYSTYQLKHDLGFHDQFARNMLQINQGNLFGNFASFIETGEYYNIAATDWSWGALLADFDLDGHKDIFITTGIPRRPNDLDYIQYTSNHTYNKDSVDFSRILDKMPDGSSRNVVFRQTGNSYEDVSARWGAGHKGYSNGLAYADLDNDGDLDIVINNLNEKATIYRNSAAQNEDANFLKVRLRGKRGNTAGVGARVTIVCGAERQMLEMSPTRGWLSAVDPSLLFGIGRATVIDSLIVDWKDGRKQFAQQIPGNQTLTFDYRDAVPTQRDSLQVRQLFTGLPGSSVIDFRHVENDYNDFNYEFLLPRMLSTEGPRMAVGDINNDGLDDIYIGGAKNQAGAIYVQQKSDTLGFVRVESGDFYTDRAEEDVAAAFIDVNKDGLADLYVVSGSGEVLKDLTGKHRLYINTGDNRFVRSNAHPQLNFNGSCVVRGDFNDDGNDDLFVGARSVAGAYGKYPSSRILLGDGKGGLHDVTARVMGPDFVLGMVTSAVWLPAVKQLAVAGDWLPLTFLSFSPGGVKVSTIPNTSGCWNTITAADLDRDGDLDLLAGNRGVNSCLKASVDFPASLYIKDFDVNGSVDPILSYYKNGHEVTFFGMDELSQQLPALKKLYLSYEKFARSSFSAVFSGDELKGAGRWQVQTFESVILENKGDSGYQVKPLPAEVQMAPVNAFLVDDFDGDGSPDILAAGNFYRNQLSIGKFDASYGHFIKGDGKGNWRVISPLLSGFAVAGEVRDIKKVKNQRGEEFIIASRNNDSLKVFSRHTARSKPISK